MKLLDLFCGAGGAAMGYHRAGFEVVGVDIQPQPNYPFEFHQADALLYLKEHGHEYDIIHTSPPCQAYSKAVTSRSSKWVPTLGKDEPRLIASVRRLIPNGKIYVIENVTGAYDELNDPAMLCGTMFGLHISRRRLFESNTPLWPVPDHPNCRGIAKSYAIKQGWEYRDMSVTGKGRHSGTSDRWKLLMGIDWPMSQHELAEAIPPVYTEWVGRKLLEEQ
jgi:hypothetical protein